MMARKGTRSFQATALGTLLAAACASAPPAPVAGPPDPALADRVAAANGLSQPLQITFRWDLEEQDGRFDGQGVTRSQPTDRARLDLFGPRGETYLTAALIGNEIRLPAGSRDVPLPPPTLLWCVLGVFTPPPGAALVASSESGSTTRLEYTAAGERWRFRFENDRLRQAEWTGRAEGRRTVDLGAAGELGLPRTATYRDHLAFVKLELELDQATAVDGFPPDIWTIGRR
jgi:hypothetical protein